MTSSSILTTFPSTNSMFRKYSADSSLMDFLPMQINASSMSLPANTLNICCHLKASLWPHTKFKSSKIGQYHEKSRIFNLSLALPTSTIISFMDIPKSQFRLCVLPTRVSPGISLMSAILPLKHFVRNRFSNPTKEQKGRDRPRKDFVNRCQVTALREGCRERK